MFTIIMDVCHNLMECPTPRLNLYNVNNGLWVIMMFRCRFINCHKCAPLVGDVNSRHHSQISGWWQGGLCMCVGKGSLCAFPSILLWIWNCFSKVLIKLLLRETYQETWYIQNTKYILMVFSKVLVKMSNSSSRMGQMHYLVHFSS